MRPIEVLSENMKNLWETYCAKAITLLPVGGLRDAFDPAGPPTAAHPARQVRNQVRTQILAENQKRKRNTFEDFRVRHSAWGRQLNNGSCKHAKGKGAPLVTHLPVGNGEGTCTSNPTTTHRVTQCA